MLNYIPDMQLSPYSFTVQLPLNMSPCANHYRKIMEKNKQRNKIFDRRLE